MKKSIKILLAVIIILIAIRIYLPYWVTDYVNRSLDAVPGYSGSIEDVDLNLYRGAYKIKTLKISKTDGDIPVPFVDIALIDLSVHWGALFKGQIAGEIVLDKPVLNFAFSGSGEEQTGSETDWTKPVKDLMPLQINRFVIIDGKVAYRDFGTKPEVNISLDSLQLEALNLSNAESRQDTLPSTITASATTIGGGMMQLNCRANILKEIPDFDLDAQLENVSLPALNDFTEAYTKLDFEAGVFNVYTELAVADGILEGYVKPILTDIKIIDLKEDSKNPLKLIWEGVASVVLSIFKNHPRDQFATQVPLQGDLNNPNTSIWPTIGNIFKNAFIRGFTKDTDNSVSFDDVVEDNK